MKNVVIYDALEGQISPIYTIHDNFIKISVDNLLRDKNFPVDAKTEFAGSVHMFNSMWQKTNLLIGKLVIASIFVKEA